MANKNNIVRKVINKVKNVGNKIVDRVVQFSPSVAIRNADTYLKKQDIKYRYLRDLPTYNDLGKDKVSKAIDQNNFSGARKIMNDTLSSLVDQYRNVPVSSEELEKKRKKYKNQ